MWVCLLYCLKSSIAFNVNLSRMQLLQFLAMPMVLCWQWDSILRAVTVICFMTNLDFKSFDVRWSEFENILYWVYSTLWFTIWKTIRKKTAWRLKNSDCYVCTSSRCPHHKSYENWSINIQRYICGMLIIICRNKYCEVESRVYIVKRN